MNDGQSEARLNVPWETEESEQSFPLLDYLQLLWFRRKLIIAITLFVAVIAYIQVNEIKNVYSAKATMMINNIKAQRVTIGIDREQIMPKFNAPSSPQGPVSPGSGRSL